MKKNMVKIVASIVLSLVVMMTLGTATLAAPPADAGVPPDHASCVAACTHVCYLSAYGGALNWVPMKARGTIPWQLDPDGNIVYDVPGVSLTAQNTISYECTWVGAELHR